MEKRQASSIHFDYQKQGDDVTISTSNDFTANADDRTVCALHFILYGLGIKPMEFPEFFVNLAELYVKSRTLGDVTISLRKLKSIMEGGTDNV